MRRRVGPRLADSDADARKHQVPVARRPTAERRHEAEERNRPCDDSSAVEAIRESRERDPDGRVEHRECEPIQEPELGVGKTEIALDRLSQYCDELPIHEVEREHDDEGRERHAAPDGACSGLVPRDGEGRKRRLRQWARGLGACLMTMS